MATGRWEGGGDGYEFFAEYVAEDFDQAELTRDIYKYNKDYLKKDLPYEEDPEKVKERQKEYLMNKFLDKANREGKEVTVAQYENFERFADMVVEDKKTEYKLPKTKRELDFRSLNEPFRKSLGERDEPETLASVKELGFTTSLSDRKDDLKDMIRGKKIVTLEPDIRELRNTLQRDPDYSSSMTKEELERLAKRRGLYTDIIDEKRLANLNARQINSAWESNVTLNKFSPDAFLRNIDKDLERAEKNNDLDLIKKIKENLLDIRKSKVRGPDQVNEYQIYLREEKADNIVKEINPRYDFENKPVDELATLLALKTGKNVNSILRWTDKRIANEAKKEGLGLRVGENPSQLEKAFAVAKIRLELPKKQLLDERLTKNNQTKLVNTWLFEELEEFQKKAEKIDPGTLDLKAKVFKPPKIPTKDIAVLESDLPDIKPDRYNALLEEFAKTPRGVGVSILDMEAKAKDFIGRKYPGKKDEEVNELVRKEVLANLNIFKPEEATKPVPIFDELLESSFAKLKGKDRLDLTLGDFEELSGFTNSQFKTKLVSDLKGKVSHYYDMWPEYKKNLRQNVEQIKAQQGGVEEAEQ